MEFKTVSIIKYPVEVVWPVFRDRLPEVGQLIDDVAFIRLESKQERTDGKTETVYTWQADPSLPALIKDHFRPEMLSWTDTAVWDEAEHLCRWRIESHYFKKQLQCEGLTRFEPAIGGRGARLTFQGAMTWEGRLPLSMGIMDAAIARGVETFLVKIIPQNFQQMAQAVGRFLEEN